jgi:redox-sensitive bicupin YhaK (pirin superfamily)
VIPEIDKGRRPHRSSSHSPITRLVSPSDLGQAMKPFVFLDYFDIDPKRMPPIDFHPHSGIETVTVVLQGKFSHQEPMVLDHR